MVVEVTLYGSFNNWTEGIAMWYNEETGISSCSIQLQQGAYQYKFKIGSKWCCDIEKNRIVDDNANENNIIIIE